MQAGFGPSRTAFNDLESEITAANVSRLVPAWTGSLGGQFAAEPLVDAGSAYARSDGRLSSFNLETGATRWSVAVGSAGDLAGGSAAVPVLANGSLWVPTTGRTACALVRINPADGTTISTLTHNVVPPDIPPSAMIVTRCQTGDALSTGSKVVIPIPCTIGQQCPPPAAWSVDVGGEVVTPPVALSNGDVAVGRAGGQVVVIDGTIHAVEWTAPGGSFFPLAATPASIYAVSSVAPGVTTIVSALPADGCGSSTCTPTWTSTLPLGPNGRASIGGDVLYVGHGSVISALPAAGCGASTCTPLWDGSATTTQGISSPPVIDSGVVLVGNRVGTVAAFSLPT